MHANNLWFLIPALLHFPCLNAAAKSEQKAKSENKPYILSRKTELPNDTEQKEIAVGQEWSYQGASGPHHWGDLKPEYRMCKTGSQQSPLDIRTPHKTQLPALRFDYKPSVISLVHAGYGVQFNYSPGQAQDHKGRELKIEASQLRVDDKAYPLKEIIFRSPSEHLIEGRSYPIEVQLQHQNSKGQIVMVSLFLTQGKRNDFLKTLWTHLPVQPQQKNQVPHAYINIEGLLPSSTSYYSYMGSLTMPPCTEQVTWHILQEPIEISEEQIETYRKIIANNARPPQARNERYILKN